MEEEILVKLQNLIKATTNYEIPATDNNLILYLYQNECQAILNDCNLLELPSELKYVAEERTAGRYIQLKKFDILGADNLEVVTQIKEGDTTVELDGSAVDERLDSLANALLKGRDVSCLRKLRW